MRISVVLSGPVTIPHNTLISGGLSFIVMGSSGLYVVLIMGVLIELVDLLLQEEAPGVAQQWYGTSDHHIRQPEERG